MQKFLSITSCAVFISLVALAQPLDPLASYRSLANAGQSQEALHTLLTIFESEKNPAMKAKEALALGVLNFNSSKKEVAQSFLKTALELKTHLDDYAEFYLGLIARDNKNWDEAKKHFIAVQTHTPKSSKAAEAEIELARLARARKSWGQAYGLMTKLERRFRNTEYPNILFDLSEITGALKKRSEQCKYAVKLYSRYPAFALSKGWGADFSAVKIRDTSINCQLDTKDRDKRISNLLLGGEFEEVHSEINSWYSLLKADKKTRPEDFGHLEIANGQLNLAEGNIKDAIAHFQSAQEFLGRNNFTAQMLLSRGYSLADDYPRAVEGYLKAYEINPHAKLGQKALFQAAFLSYQNRDYDGASRHFEDAVKHARGKLAWDSRWHLAWIRYLKGDYEGALKDFTELTKDRKFAKGVDLEKINYWRGMSNLRLQNYDQARQVFTQLSQLKRLGYYTGAALARLNLLPSTNPPPLVSLPNSASQVMPKPSPSRTPSAFGAQDSNQNSGTDGRTTALIEVSSLRFGFFGRKPASEVAGETVNSIESLTPEKETDKTDEEKSAEEDEQSPEALADAPPITSLKNSALVERFDRAHDLMDIGFSAWAQSELREIEKRTSNRTYLQSLMSEYHKAGDYYRSATIADLVFETQREKDGVDGANLLWQYAFPQAYTKQVFASCKKFDVPQALVWGVMRGESGYREEIHSSAGAIGLMQMIPPTAKKVARELSISDFKTNDLILPETNILFGVRYLKRLNKTMGGNLPLTIASYNAGPHRVQGWLKDFGGLDMDEFIEHIPYLETRNYVKKVLRNYLVYETLYGKKTNLLSWLAKKPTIKFDGPKPLAESWEEQP
jgi:soluble lytic murein transglycosylase